MAAGGEFRKTSGDRVTNFPSAWATGNSRASIPRRKTDFPPTAPRWTQRSSYLPESFQARVAAGPSRGSSARRMPDLMSTWKPLQMPRISLSAAWKSLDGVGEVVADLVGQDAAGSHVVAIAESAGHAENLELVGQIGLFQQPVDVDVPGLGPRLLEGGGGLFVAVGAGGAEDEDLRLGHRGFRVQGSGFRVQGSGFRVQGSGFRVQAVGIQSRAVSARGSGPVL